MGKTERGVLCQSKKLKQNEMQMLHSPLPLSNKLLRHDFDFPHREQCERHKNYTKRDTLPICEPTVEILENKRKVRFLHMLKKITATNMSKHKSMNQQENTRRKLTKRSDRLI